MNTLIFRVVLCTVLFFSQYLVTLANEYDIFNPQTNTTGIKNETNHLVADYFYRADSFLQEGKIDSANKMLLRLVDAAGLMPPIQKIAYKNLASNYKKQGKYQESLKYFELYSVLKNSLDSLQNARNIIGLNQQLKNVTNKKHEEHLVYQSNLNEIAAENEKLIFWLQFSGLLLLLLMIVSGVFFLLKRSQYLGKLEVAEEKFVRQNEAYGKIIYEGEKDRINVANELYNGLGKVLSRTKMQMYLLEDLVQKDNKQLVDDTIELLELGVSKTQSMSRYLIPGDLVMSGLVPAINELIDKLRRGRTIYVDFEYDDYAIQPPLETEVSLYRIIQEILENTMKDSKVSQIAIALKSNGSQISLHVTDNGRITTTAQYQKEYNKTWTNLNTRIHLLNGALIINPGKKQGTTIKVELTS